MYGHPRQLVTFVLLVGIFSAGLMSRGIAAELLSPEEARKLFVTAIPLQIELAASEPTIVDPVHLAFDEQGRLWVVEMRDYPNGPAPGQPPISRIKILRDLDGDGVYEKATVFADQLLFATSLLPWKGESSWPWREKSSGCGTTMETTAWIIGKFGWKGSRRKIPNCEPIIPRSDRMAGSIFQTVCA